MSCTILIQFNTNHKIYKFNEYALVHLLHYILSSDYNFKQFIPPSPKYPQFCNHLQYLLASMIHMGALP